MRIESLEEWLESEVKNLHGLDEFGKKLHKMNILDKEIKKLEKFIRTAGNVWGGKLIDKRRKRIEITNANQVTIFKSNPFGGCKSEEYGMPYWVRNKILKMLEEELKEMEELLNKYLSNKKDL